MKKKFFCLALALILSVSMIACGGESVETGEVNSVGETPSTESEVVVSDVEEESVTDAPEFWSVEEFEACIEEIVLTPENVSDYFEVTKVEEEYLDAFGDPTGEKDIQYIMVLKEGYYVYPEQVVIRWEWEDGSQSFDHIFPVGEKDSYMFSYVQGMYEDTVIEGNCTKVTGSICTINIPDEMWITEEILGAEEVVELLKQPHINVRDENFNVTTIFK